jgi:hypothetical protein
MADCINLIEQRLGKKLPSNFVADLRKRTAEAFKNDLLPIDGIEKALKEISFPI